MSAGRATTHWHLHLALVDRRLEPLRVPRRNGLHRPAVHRHRLLAGWQLLWATVWVMGLRFLTRDAENETV
jgi:hypothetical protein